MILKVGNGEGGTGEPIGISGLCGRDYYTYTVSNSGDQTKRGGRRFFISCEACPSQLRGFLLGYPVCWQRRLKGEGNGNTPSVKRRSRPFGLTDTMAVLCCENADVALIQEPWIYCSQIWGSVSLGKTYFLLYPRGIQGPPSMQGITLMLNLCWSSVTRTQQWWETDTNGGSGKIITACTVYILQDWWAKAYQGSEECNDLLQKQEKVSLHRMRYTDTSYSMGSRSLNPWGGSLPTTSIHNFCE